MNESSPKYLDKAATKARARFQIQQLQQQQGASCVPGAVFTVCPGTTAGLGYWESYRGGTLETRLGLVCLYSLPNVERHNSHFEQLRGSVRG